MISGLNGYGTVEGMGRNNWGGVLVKIDTFDLRSPIGTRLGEILVDVVGDFLGLRWEDVTEDESISWETSTG